MPVLVRTLIFAVLIPGSVTIGIPFLLLSSGVELLSFEVGGFRFVGTLPMAIGVGVITWCAADFALVGRGTPAPIDAPRTLITTGLYRMVRNPMYVGVELILWGEALVFQSLTLAIYALILWSLFHLFVVTVEEPGLKEKFGPAYEQYCDAVPRWVPRLGHLKRSG